MTERDYEQEAQEQGWKPESDWTDPDKPWIDAKTFVEKGERIAGIARSRADRERTQFESRIERLERANKDFGQYTKQLREKDQAKSAAKIAQLEAQLAAAVSNSDGEAFDQVNRQIQAERETMAPPPVNGDQQHPLAEAWLMNNPWYNENPKLKTYADGLSEIVGQEGYTGQAYFSEITRRVRADFPEEFENPRQSGGNTVEAGSQKTGPKDKSAHTYENLDPDSKRNCDEFVAEGLITREDYLKTFEWNK